MFIVLYGARPSGSSPAAGKVDQSRPPPACTHAFDGSKANTGSLWTLQRFWLSSGPCCRKGTRVQLDFKNLYSQSEMPDWRANFSSMKAKQRHKADAYGDVLTNSGGKFAAKTVVSACEYRFLKLIHYILPNFHLLYHRLPPIARPGRGRRQLMPAYVDKPSGTCYR